MSTSPNLQALHKNGYIILRNAIPPAQLQELRIAAEKVTARARKGGWRWVRRCERMFPPWREVEVGVEGGGEGEIPIWGVQHLLHPLLPEANVFAKFYFSDIIMNVVKQLFGFPPPLLPPLKTDAGKYEDGDEQDGKELMVKMMEEEQEEGEDVVSLFASSIQNQLGGFKFLISVATNQHDPTKTFRLYTPANFFPLPGPWPG